MATITNIPYIAKSLNGLIVISDGVATLQNGNLEATNINTTNITSDTHTVDGTFTVNGNCNLGDSSLDIHNVKGKMTFVDTLPECSLLPANGYQLANRNYVEGTYVKKIGNVNENIDGIKTFAVPPETSVSATTNNQLANKLYVDTKFNSIDLSNYMTLNTAQTATANKRFTNISLNKANTTNVFDVSGTANFDTPSASITLTNPNFTTFTGFTTPVKPTQTTLISNANNTQTLNGWTITMGTLGTTIWSNGNNGLEFFSNPPAGYTYFLWNRSYQGTNYTLQQTITLNAGIYILTFLSYWGYQNVSSGGASQASLTISVLNSTDTYVYSDPDTRNGVFWRTHTFRFTVNTTGSSYIRWTPSDSTPVGTPFPWAIAGVSLVRYNSLQITNTTNSQVSYFGGSLSVLRNAYINNIYGSGVLSLTGSPSFVLPSPNINCLSINSSFGTYGTQSNSNSLMVGQGVGQYGQTYSRMIGIGYNINDSASPPITSGTRCVVLGSNIRTAQNEDVLIGHFVKSSNDPTGQNVAIGTNIGISTPDQLDGVGVGRRTVAIGSGIYSGTYNGFGLAPAQPLECVSIGYFGQRFSMDNFNTSCGAYALQNIKGTNNVSGSGIPTGYFTQKNTAVGWSAGTTQSLLNNCCFFGASADATVNDISNSCVFGANSTVGASFATSIGSGVVNNTPNSVRLGRAIDGVYIDGSLNVVGLATFTLPPETTASIASNNQLTNKLYVDTAISALNIANYVDLTNPQTITGIKTFSTLPETSTLATTNTQLTNKLYVDNAISALNISNYVDLSNPQTITGLKTFSTLPESASNPTTNNQLVRKLYVDNNFVDLTTAQTINAIKTFRPIQTYKYSNTNVEIGNEVVNASTNVDNTGINSIYVGYRSGFSLNAGIIKNNRNVLIGADSGKSMTQSIDNVFIGNATGLNLNTSTNASNENVLIGASCFNNITNITDSVSIGFGCGSGITTATTWDKNVSIGTTQFITDCKASSKSIFLGADILAYNTTAISNNVLIGANGYINGNFSNSVAISGFEPYINSSNTFYVGDDVYTTKTILNERTYPTQSTNTLISSATTLAFPLYEYYSVRATSAFTITLPTIAEKHLGTRVIFRRVGGTTTIVVSFIGNGTQRVYNTALTGGTTAQALMGSGAYRVSLVALVDNTVGTYAWFQE